MRTVLSLVFLAALLWASCTVKLGRHTLAEHVDRIGQTDEAKALLEGTRGKISPVLEDMKQRVFGEYVEAPTSESVVKAGREAKVARESKAKSPPPARESREPRELREPREPRESRPAPAAVRGPRVAEEPRLPGTRR